MKKIWNLTTKNIVLIPIILILIGSINSLAHVFASVDGSIRLGWIKAVGVDIGMIFIMHKLMSDNKNMVVWSTLIFITAVSIYGNFIYPMVLDGEKLTGIWLTLKHIILSATLPLLGIGLVWSFNIHKPSSPTPKKQPIAKVKKQPTNKLIRQSKLQELWLSGITEIKSLAAQFEVNEKTITRDIKEMRLK